jgi:hypothetical protein
MQDSPVFDPQNLTTPDETALNEVPTPQPEVIQPEAYQVDTTQPQDIMASVPTSYDTVAVQEAPIANEPMPVVEAQAENPVIPEPVIETPAVDNSSVVAASMMASTPTPVVEVLPEIPTSSTMPPTKKGGKGKVIACSVIALLAIICIVVLVVVAFVVTKGKFIPGVSPLVENLTQSPSEQLANRLDPYMQTTADLIAKLDPSDPTAMTKLAEDKNLAQFKSQNTVASEVELNVDINTDFNLNNVLGIESDTALLAPAPSPTDDLSKFSQGKQYNINLKASGKSNNFDNKASSQQTMKLTAASNGITLSADAEAITIDDTNYIKINSIPGFGLGLFEKAVGKWYVITPETLKTLSSASTSTTSSYNQETKDAFTKISNGLKNSRAFFDLPTVKKNIALAGEEEFHGMTLKCYSLVISRTDLPKMIDEVNGLIKDDKDKIKYSAGDFDSLSGIGFKVCFNKNSVDVHKIELSLEVEQKDSTTKQTNLTMKYVLKTSMYDTGSRAEIKAPAPVTDIKELQNDLGIPGTITPPTTSSADTERKAAVQDIEVGIQMYIDKYNTYPATLYFDQVTSAVYIGSRSAECKVDAYCVKVPLKGVAKPSSTMLIDSANTKFLNFATSSTATKYFYALTDTDEHYIGACLQSGSMKYQVGTVDAPETINCGTPINY